MSFLVFDGFNILRPEIITIQLEKGIYLGRFMMTYGNDLEKSRDNGPSRA